MENQSFSEKTVETRFEDFFLEHVSHYFSCSICGKNFNPIG
jgi:hypothetical protein